MNPDNNALDRTFFIGGAPRVGKSLLAYKLAKGISGHVVSTDAIRSAAKKASTEKDGSLFKINVYNDLSEAEWLHIHLNNANKVVEDQNSESKAFWNSVVSFCNTFCEDSEHHIVEGVALLPSLVASMKHQPSHVIYVGNTSDAHVEALLDYGRKFPEQDWMVALGYSENKVRAMAHFVKEMSLYFKNEAEQNGFKYYEITDSNFDSDLDAIIEEIT